MRNNRKYSLIIANHASDKVLRVSLPFPTLGALAFLAILSLIGACAAAYHYGQVFFKAADYNHLVFENDSYRSENDQFRIKTAMLGERIEMLETLATKLRTVSGMDSDRQVGGLQLEHFARSLPASAGSLQAIEGYRRSVTGLETQYRSIDQRLSQEFLIQSATPDRLPVRGYVTAGLGLREDPLDGSRTEHHAGLDISAPYGSPVHSPADGIVVYAGQREGYGNVVVIDHKFGYVTRYGHLSRMNVETGQHVSRSDVIGFVGTSGRTTGPHLHYELWWNNILLNPNKLLAENR